MPSKTLSKRGEMTSRLEDHIAAIEGGAEGLFIINGNIALRCLFESLAVAGDQILFAGRPDVNTCHVIRQLNEQGIEVVVCLRPQFILIEALINNRTRAIYTLSATLPSCEQSDIEQLSDISQAFHIPLIVDNSMMTNRLFSPIEHGADIVIYPSLHFLAGAKLSHCGLIVDSGMYDWKNGQRIYQKQKTQRFSSPIKRLEPEKIIDRCRSKLASYNIPPPGDRLASNVLQGLILQANRISERCNNAKILAKFLTSHQRVSFVNYPLTDVDSSIKYSSTDQQLTPLPFLSFAVKGEKKQTIVILNRLNGRYSLGIGNDETTVIYAASKRYESFTEKERINAIAVDNVICIIPGLEPAGTLIHELEHALN